MSERTPDPSSRTEPQEAGALEPAPERLLPELPDPRTSVPRPGFAVTPPAAAQPGFDPSNSPLARGGKPGPAPAPADASLAGIKRRDILGQPRVTYRVRREGWVSRRSAARERFRTLGEQRESSVPRLLAGLDRRGLLARSKGNAVRPRFNLRGHM